MLVLLPLAALLATALALVCVALLCHGLDPLRLLRASFKRPRLHLASAAGEKEALLAHDRKARTLFGYEVKRL